MDYRHEVKHIITAGDAAAIRTNLSAVAHLDPHAKENGYYRIRSLYFDDPMDTWIWTAVCAAVLLTAVLIIRKTRDHNN